MKVKYYSVVLIFALIFASCVTKTQHQSQEDECVDTLIIEEDNFIPDEKYIDSLIRKDLEKRNWMAGIDTSSSSLFYKTLHDDNIIILYRVIPHGKKTCVAAIEDINIAVNGDDICFTDSNGVIYEHKGYYEIVDDSTVDIFFDKLYSNHYSVNDSVIFEPIYHIKCMHRYRLSGVDWNKINADTAIVIDEREKAFCEDIWMYTN